MRPTGTVWCRALDVRLAYESGTGIAGVRLHATRCPTGESLPGDGLLFPGAGEARDYCKALGYVLPYRWVNDRLVPVD